MTKAFISLCLLCCTMIALAQKKNTTPVQAVTLQPDNWDFKAGTVEFAEYKARPSMRLLTRTRAVLKNTDLTDGTIEFDYDPLDRGFASMYFRWQDTLENECFYFRTHAAGDPNAMDGVQYTPVVHGVNLWDVFGYYQGNATFQKQTWNHVKLVISGKQMRVYVNSDTKPTLEIPRLEGNTAHGTLAFEGESAISNLVIKPNQVEGLLPHEGIDPTDNDPRYIRHWQVSAPAIIPKGIDFSSDLMPSKETIWQTIDAERRGLINLTRGYGASPARRIVWLKVNILSEKVQKRTINLGFSDEVWVFINGRYLYVDKNYYAQPIMKEPDGRLSIENTSFSLPLQQGDNELLIGVGNNFYGWGIAARLDKMEGLRFSIFK